MLILLLLGLSVLLLILLLLGLSVLSTVLSSGSLISVLSLLTVLSLLSILGLLSVLGLVSIGWGCVGLGNGTTVSLGPLDVEPVLAEAWDEVSQLHILRMFTPDTYNNIMSLSVESSNLLLMLRFLLSEGFGDSSGQRANGLGSLSDHVLKLSIELTLDVINCFVGLFTKPLQVV